MNFFTHTHRKVKEERCRARCLVSNGKIVSFTGGKHNHPPHTEKIEKICRKEKERSIKNVIKKEESTF